MPKSPNINSGPDGHADPGSSRDQRTPRILSVWYVISLVYASYFAFGLADNGRGPMFPDILREFSLTDAQGGLFFFTASTAALVNNLILFKTMERRGAYWTLQVYSVTQCLGLFMVGWAPNYAWVLIGCAIFGTSFGGLGIAHNILVAEAAPVAKRRQLLAGLHSTYGIASLAAPLFITLMYRYGYSWRSVMTAFALGPALVFFASLRTDAKTQRQLSATANEREYGSEASSSSASLASFPKRLALLYSLIASFYVVAEIGLSSRLALLVRRDWGYTVNSANFLVTGFFVGMFVGRLLFALVPTRYSDTKILVLSLCASFIAFALGLLHNPLWLALAGLTMSMFYPVFISMIKHDTGRFAGYVTSWCITVQSLWLMLMHLVLGELSDRFGLGAALWLGPSCLICAAALLAYLAKTKSARTFAF